MPWRVEDRRGLIDVEWTDEKPDGIRPMFRTFGLAKEHAMQVLDGRIRLLRRNKGDLQRLRARYRAAS